MPNVITITFSSLPSVDDTITFDVNLLGAPYEKSETFQAIRNEPNEVTIGAITTETAANFAAALEADYPKEFSVTANGNSVSIFSIGGHTIENVLISGDFATFETNELLIAVSGLEYDRYLINNEIWLTFGTGALSPYYDLNFFNQGNLKQFDARVYANSNGISRVNIAPYIKGLFAYPSDAPNYLFNSQLVNNSQTFTITVSVVDIGEYVIEKTFVRGGNRTNDTNQHLASNETLRPTYKLPVWAGYETADYGFTELNQMVKLLLSETDLAKRDPQRRKGCNEIYVKWLNQKGGYCHWLFNSHERSEQGGSEGTFVLNNEVTDLGGKSDNKIKVFGKFPEYYKSYIQDLVISPEVYIWQNNDWVRVSLAKNTSVYDSVQRAYNVTINIEYNYRFNPTILWSN